MFTETRNREHDKPKIINVKIIAAVKFGQTIGALAIFTMPDMEDKGRYIPVRNRKMNIIFNTR